VSEKLPSEPRRCVFCCDPSRPTTREHVWPDWILRLLDAELNYTDVQVERGGAFRRSPKPDATVKHVCQSCNTGWMSVLESTVQPTLTPMILGQGPLTLTTETQRAVACWAMKTALMLELYYPRDDRQLPQALYALFFQQRRPPNHCGIWAAAYRGDHIGLRAFSSRMTMTRPATYTREGVIETPGTRVRGVLQTLCAFRAIFQLVVFDGASPPDVVSNPMGSIRIWPATGGSPDWPHNMEAFDEAEFQSLVCRTVDGYSFVRER
jgi:hypothetical protein